MSPDTTRFASPWPHRLAVLLAWATFPLIWVGGLVTTYDAGMAVPDWPTTYGYNMFLYPWQTWLAAPWDLFIEHGHRLLASAVGLLTILLVAVLWRCERRGWVCWLGVAALMAVVFQGVLGGLRVRLDERLLAQLHGCVGPAFFALAVALCVFTSPRWLEQKKPGALGGWLSWLAIATAAVAYLQLVLGSQLRHVPPEAGVAGFRLAVFLHLAGAAALVGLVVWLLARLLAAHPTGRWLTRPARLLAGLVAVQLALGLGAWVVNYGWPVWFADYAWAQRLVVQRMGAAQATVTTAHVALGSLILGTAVALALRACRLAAAPLARAVWLESEAAA
ncbi:MAG: COX15/CtaA family protein [Pirellulales bacterium]